MPDRLVHAEGVRYAVGDAVLVDGVDLAARAGELVAILGPNGAGKSTLLRLLSGDLKPQDGAISIAGLDTRSTPPSDLAPVRAVLRQGGRSDIPFTATAVVEMGRYPRRRDPDASREGDREAIAVAMERTNTVHLASRVYATLSGGEQTRVTVARVLAQEPAVMLLDEPITALDVAHQEQIMREFRRSADEGACVIAVLHDLNVAAHYADRIVLMTNARIEADGPATSVLEASLLSRVYGQQMQVVPHPSRDCPLVLVADGEQA